MQHRKALSLGVITGTVVTSAVFFTPPARADVDFGVGLMGTVGGDFLDKPNRANNPDIYPGYSGFTAGGGLMLDGRVLKGLLGLEIDILRTSDKGHGDITLNGVTFTHTIGQGAWHVPVLAKITVPTPLASPQFFLGPEFVFPSSPESKLDPNLLGSATPVATADTYVSFTFGVGVEIKLPLPLLDIRIPLGLRGSYTPSVSSNFSDRVNLASSPWQYHSEWKYAVNLTGGAAIYF